MNEEVKLEVSNMIAASLAEATTSIMGKFGELHSTHLKEADLAAHPKLAPLIQEVAGMKTQLAAAIESVKALQTTPDPVAQTVDDIVADYLKNR